MAIKLSSSNVLTSTPLSAPTSAPPTGTERLKGSFRYAREATRLVFDTNRSVALWLVLLTILSALLPALIALIGKQIVDSVVNASKHHNDQRVVMWFLVAELIAVVVLSAAQRGLSYCQNLMHAELGHRINVLILQKAVTLSLSQFEDADYYDKLLRAQREASMRPLNLVNRYLSFAQNGISLVAFSSLLGLFSLWAVAGLVLSALPAFIAETKFSVQAFRLFRWRSPERRKQVYLETVISREDHAKEIKLFRIAPLLLKRYNDVFRNYYDDDRALAGRRARWGYGLGLISTLGFYSAYVFIAWSAVRLTITLGEMTMYLMLFRQGQSAVNACLNAISGMYEDNLYLSTLFEFLDEPTQVAQGTLTQGPEPTAGLTLDHVTFSYPGSNHNALEGISFDVKPGQNLAIVGANGSGKTTLVKLITGLYHPTRGQIKLEGATLGDWNREAVAAHYNVIFQDFVRYQFHVGENIGISEPKSFDNESSWRQAAARSQAAAFIETLPDQYRTQLGKWFKEGVELSGGQWQKVALTRVLLRPDARIVVLDEPTSALDANAEADMHQAIRSFAKEHGQACILITHRLAHVRDADQIIVLDKGRIVEQGNHATLIAKHGVYAQMFDKQAAGYSAR